MWFCGRHDDEVSAFAEVASRPCRICGECLGLCLDVTCELDKRAEREALAAQLASFTARRAFSERLEPKPLSGDIDGVAEVMREFGYGDVDPDQVRALLDSLRNRPSCCVGTRLPGSAADDKCASGTPSGTKSPSSSWDQQARRSAIAVLTTRVPTFWPPWFRPDRGRSHP